LRHLHWFRFNHVVDGREKTKRGLTLERFMQEHEAHLPQEYLVDDPVPKGPVRRAMVEYLGQRAAAISDALERCGVTHDRESVRAALTGESVTEQEWSWDVGNLPRFLEAIGLGEVFPGWRDEIESDKRADEEARAAHRAAEPPPEDRVEAILERLGHVAPSPVDDGPVTMTFSSLWMLPWSCHNDVEMAWIVRPSQPTKLRWPKLEGLNVVARDGTWRIDHPWCSVSQRARMIAKLETALAKLPEDSEVELIAADVPEPDDQDPPVIAGNMRFHAKLVKGA
jgi:hypothetical protein